jgi:hypothetical protein
MLDLLSLDDTSHWEGSENWIQFEFELYLVAFLATVASFRPDDYELSSSYKDLDKSRKK